MHYHLPMVLILVALLVSATSTANRSAVTISRRAPPTCIPDSVSLMGR